MLLKVNDGNGGWHLFDKVDQCHFVASHSVGKREDMSRLDDPESPAVNLIARECFSKGASVDVGVIEFYRGSLKQRVLFASSAYVCNDRGDTLERINVGHQKGRSR
jgi:hypothetical protein